MKEKNNKIIYVITALLLVLVVGAGVLISYNMISGKNSDSKSSEKESFEIEKPKTEVKELTLDDEELNNLYQTWYVVDSCLIYSVPYLDYLGKDVKDNYGMILAAFIQFIKNEDYSLSYCHELDETTIDDEKFEKWKYTCGDNQLLDDVFMNDDGSIDVSSPDFQTFMKYEWTKTVKGDVLRQKIKDMFGVENITDYPDIKVYSGCSLYRYNESTNKYYFYSGHNCGGTYIEPKVDVSGKKENDKIFMIIVETYEYDNSSITYNYEFKYNDETGTYILKNLDIVK